MDKFFEEKEILVKYKDNASLLNMRPLKVRELKEVFRINELPKEEDDTFRELIGLIAPTITVKLGPANLLQTMLMFGEYVELGKILDMFIDLNYSAAKETGSDKCELAEAIDSLINQGHNSDAILDYTLPQFIAYQKAACKRMENLSGKKKKKPTTPFDFFKGMNVPIRYCN